MVNTLNDLLWEDILCYNGHTYLSLDLEHFRACIAPMSCSQYTYTPTLVLSLMIVKFMVNTYPFGEIYCSEFNELQAVCENRQWRLVDDDTINTACLHFGELVHIFKTCVYPTHVFGLIFSGHTILFLPVPVLALQTLIFLDSIMRGLIASVVVCKWCISCLMSWSILQTRERHLWTQVKSLSLVTSSSWTIFLTPCNHRHHRWYQRTFVFH